MIKINSKTIILSCILILISVSIFSYFSPTLRAAPDNEVNGLPTAMPVTVEIIKPSALRIWSDYSARLEAVGFAEIRPQVSGRITEIKFSDGQMIQADEIIYVIDPRQFQATLKEAQAQLSSRKFEADLALKELNRAKSLIETDAISQRILDERKSASQIANSAVKSAEAMVEKAQINLDYAFVKAPISGKMSRAEIKVGNVVEAGPNAPILTSIVATDRIFADFDVSEDDYIELSVLEGDQKDIPVELYVGKNTTPINGLVDSFDNRINPTTGTIRARAIFQNEKGLLLPGMFAKIKIGQADKQNVIAVSEDVISTDQDRKFVYVVNDKNMTEYREVKLGATTQGKRIITYGLSEGEKIITEGLIRMRPNMLVDPQVKDTKSNKEI